MVVDGDYSISCSDELAMTVDQIQVEASNGRYYSYEKHKWVDMGGLEWILRSVAAFLFNNKITRNAWGYTWVDSPKTVCCRHTWNAIEKMPKVPIEIANCITNLFHEALSHTSPLTRYSNSITRIFSRVLSEQSRQQGRVLAEIDIQWHKEVDRCFAVFYNRIATYRIANTSYGQINIYNEQGKLENVNSYDNLMDNDHHLIGLIKLAVDYEDEVRLSAAIEMFSADGHPYFRVDETSEKTNLIFRDWITNQVIAVANYYPPDINWKITVIDSAIVEQNSHAYLLMTWATLKYAQHYQFPNTDHVPYFNPKYTPLFGDGVPPPQALKEV